MGIVAAMHVGVLYLIASSLGIVPSIAPTKTEATIIDEAPRRDEPPPQPEYVPPRNDTVVLPDDPHPDLVFEQEVITPPPADLSVPPEPPVGSAVVQPVIVPVSQDSRYPLSKPLYSPRMIREGNQGTIEVDVYVLPNGRVGDARVAKSTGFQELDLATLEEAKRKWRLQPATRDGVAFAQWHRVRVTFKLNEQR